jgi:hypothetical protein
MHTNRSFRPLFAVLALAALLLAPCPAAAAPSRPIDSFTGWLAGLWANVGLSWDPDGAVGGEPVSTTTAGLIWDPSGEASAGGSGIPPAGTDGANVGCIWDPSGTP